MPSTPVDVNAQPSGVGCVECLHDPEGWWFHLRRCAECGHIGCCDSSPGQHSSRHAAESGHPIIRSFEPGETWFWDFRIQAMVDGPELAPPDSHPAEQTTPGPADRVPTDWQSRLH
ncbi:MAG: UBP-type zinc finger domain-containing protein [Actinomycetota bacterium]|nr:UBP-type zinc finger domain-containing protein [Actinomycetota bacterium]